MRKEEGFIERAQAAFYAFSFRFAVEVSKKCEIICKNWGLDSDFAAEVSDETFKRFWKYPKYEIKRTKTTDIDKAVLLYLFKIAKNVLIDIWNKKNCTNKNPYEGNEEIVWDFPPDDNDCGEIENIHSHHAIVKKVISCLSPKHKVIFLTYAKYQQTGFKLPRKLLSDLRKELNISQQTIRSYKNEVFNKINEYLKIYEIK